MGLTERSCHSHALTDRVSVVIPRRTGPAAAAEATFRRRAGSMVVTRSTCARHGVQFERR